MVIISEITGELSKHFEERPLINKVNAFLDENNENIIILAAYRRRGGKYKKLTETTTTKATTTTTTEAVQSTTEEVITTTTEELEKVTQDVKPKTVTNVSRNQLKNSEAAWLARKRVTRPPKIVQPKKVVKVNVIDEEEYSVRRARYLFTQRSGR